MNAEQAAVAAFHRKFGHPVADRPTAIKPERIELRARLLAEEMDEIDAALADLFDGGDIAVRHAAEELADIIIVAYGAACELGVDLGPVIAAKMASNMTKSMDKRADGKILKGPDYVAPDIEAVIRAQPEGAME